MLFLNSDREICTVFLPDFLHTTGFRIEIDSTFQYKMHVETACSTTGIVNIKKKAEESHLTLIIR